MKKILSILLAGMMAFTMIGCGTNKTTENSESQSDATEGKESTKNQEKVDGAEKLVVAWWGNQVRNERTQQALDLYSEQNAGIVFDGQFAEWGDYWTKLATAAAGQKLPDVIQMDYSYLKQYAENELLVDLNPYVESGVLDVSGIDPGILEAGSVDGKLYALCIGVNAPALFYNKTLLEENNIEIKDNMTLEDFYEISRQVYEKTGMKTDIAYGDGGNYIDYIMRGEGIGLYDGDKFAAESPADFEAYYDIYQKGLDEEWMCRPEIFTERSLGSLEEMPFVYGTTPDTRSWCALAMSNQMEALYGPAEALGFEVGVTTWPAKDPKKANYLKPGQFLSVSINSKNPEEAAKVLDFWTNSVECNEILLGERGVPASKETAEAIAPKINEIQQIASAYVNDVVTPNCSAVSPPAPKNSGEMRNLYLTLQEQFCYQQMDVEEAAKQLFEQGNAILAK